LQSILNANEHLRQEISFFSSSSNPNRPLSTTNRKAKQEKQAINRLMRPTYSSQLRSKSGAQNNSRKKSNTLGSNENLTFANLHSHRRTDSEISLNNALHDFDYPLPFNAGGHVKFINDFFKKN